MKTAQAIKCQSCGASSVTKHEHQPALMVCEYCGSMMVANTGDQVTNNQQQPHSSFKLTVLLLVLPLLVVLLMVVYWVVFKETRKQVLVTNSQQSINTPVNQLTAVTDAQSTKLPQGQSVQLTHAEQGLAADQLTIENHTFGKTSNGGLFWVFDVKNSGQQIVAKPGAVVSLFDDMGKRLAEQSGWSIKELIRPGEATTVLVFLAKPPAIYNQLKTAALAQEPTHYNTGQFNLNVTDYTISKDRNQYVLVGDVINDQEAPVRFIRVVAVAQDESGKDIGLGHSFATEKLLNPGESSGFKINLGTFLVGEPSQWSVWSVARQL